MNTTKRYRFHWFDGKKEEGEGYSPSDALSRLGYGGGAVRALDYYELIDGDVSRLMEVLAYE